MVRPYLIQSARFQRLWRQAACFALLALMVRAVVPAGYMPAIPAQAAGGILWLSLCGVDGRPLRAVVITSLDDTDTSGSTAVEGCPFGLLAAAAGGPLPSALEPLPWPPAAAPTPMPASGLPTAPRIPGPPLGSRAPPVA
ncbi:MAG: DUF2946 domain-containing protein [Pigmentiphaga sp.]|nr:DUF2946 domain-containing protein [Pigmentiphaga sp.]